MVDPYCTVRVVWGDDERIAHPGSFDELLTLLGEVRDRLLNERADASAQDPRPPESGRVDVPAGFGVEITNCWGSLVEVGAGADAWFLFRHHPSPGRCYSDRPAITGTRVFYLDGGHHTELGADMLASPEGCLRVLRDWLESGGFPERD